MPNDIRADFPTFWTQFGQGPQPAMLLHCSLAHSGAWAGMAAQLDDLLMMTAFDKPGHGQSGAWDDSLEMQTQTAAMAIDLMQDRPMHMIGHSFGACVGLRIAVERPDLVRSLVMIDPSLVAMIRSENPDAPTDDEQVMVGFSEAMARGDRETAARVFTAAWGDGRPWQTLSQRSRDDLVARVHLIEANNASLRDDEAGLLQPGVLESLTMPVLLIQGGNTAKDVGMIVDGFERRIPNTRRVVVAGAGHMVPITHPEAVAREIRGFVNQLAAA